MWGTWLYIILIVRMDGIQIFHSMVMLCKMLMRIWMKTMQKDLSIKKTSQCDNGWILRLLTSTSKHWWHCVASGWPIEATIHCGCLCGYRTKPLEVSAPESEKKLHVNLYQSLHDAIVAGDYNVVGIGHRIIMPSSFTWSPHHMVQNYQDAMCESWIIISQIIKL